MVDTLILGHGYTASFLLKELDPSQSVLTTSRKEGRGYCFDLENEATWDQLPQAQTTYWTFPPYPYENVFKFYKKYGSRLGKLIVIGSTSGFLVEHENQEVTEQTLLDSSIERVRSEEFLLSEGALLVMSAGIYGPERSPLDWINKSLIGKSDKLVNMIHVEDLCQFLLKAKELGEIGQIYIASDNNPQSWRQAISCWEERGLVADVAEKESLRKSKKIVSQWSIEKLGVRLKFQNFVDAVS